MGASGEKPGRSCAGCGKPLSRYNTGQRCQGCVSAGRKPDPGQSGGNSGTLVDGAALARLRHERGWTQEMLAEQAGVSAVTVSKLEQSARRSARISTLSALAHALEVPVGVLLSNTVADEQVAAPARPAHRVSEAEQSRPTVLRALIAQRHWQRFQTFEAQFRHAARELAKRDHDPDLAKLTVSSRQWERWYAGNVKTEPHPDACRVLEHMFGYPIQQLLATREIGNVQQSKHSHSDQYDSVRPIPDVMPSIPGMAQIIPRADEFGLPNIFGQADENDEDAMKRRAFLMGLAAVAGLGATEPGMGLESMRHVLNQALAERNSVTDVDEWHEIALEYGHTYPITAPSELLKSLMIDVYGLQAAIGRYPDDGTQRKLRQVGAMLSAFTAQTIANLGYLRDARRWWRTARRAADESDDRYTMLWIRGREIVRAGYEHRPLTTILQLIDEAEARIGTPPPVAALPEFLSGKAQTLALMGRPASTDTEATLIRLRNVFDALPLPLKAASGSIFIWGEERLRFTESLAYTYLGDFGRADTAQGRALELYPANDLRSPAQIELQRALCLVSAGDVQPGICHAQSIVSNLPAMHRVRPIADLGHKVLRAVPIADQQRSSIQEYHECLNVSFTTPTPELTA